MPLNDLGVRFAALFSSLARNTLTILSLGSYSSKEVVVAYSRLLSVNARFLDWSCSHIITNLRTISDGRSSTAPRGTYLSAKKDSDCACRL